MPTGLVCCQSASLLLIHVYLHRPEQQAPPWCCTCLHPRRWSWYCRCSSTNLCSRCSTAGVHAHARRRCRRACLRSICHASLTIFGSCPLTCAVAVNHCSRGSGSAATAPATSETRSIERTAADACVSSQASTAMPQAKIWLARTTSSSLCRLAISSTASAETTALRCSRRRRRAAQAALAHRAAKPPKAYPPPPAAGLRDIAALTRAGGAPARDGQQLLIRILRSRGRQHVPRLETLWNSEWITIWAHDSEQELPAGTKPL